ncbi:MAG: glycosyltransferase [FCB group bacterium]|nr:glycosyltransferase [FCB group bacterium]
MVFIEGIFWCSLLIYGIALILFSIGNFIPSNPDKTTSSQPVSVIVAVKNGEASLPGLLNHLSKQQYGGELEFIIVDDGSTDQTAHIIRNYIADDARFKYVSSADGDGKLSHKKKALDAGITLASGELLLFTDVDCRMSPNWVQAMSSALTKNTDYLIGYSRVVPTGTLVSRFQSLDFYLLMAGARGMTLLGSPWASTGQNQGYRKRIYTDVGGFSAIADCLQGDDSLFLQVIRRSGKVNVRFADDPDAFVTGRTEKSWGALMRQRIRWAGDANLMWKYNPIFYGVVLATFFTNFSLVVLSGIMVFSGEYSMLVFGGMTVKFIPEFLLYTSALTNFKTKFDGVGFLFWFFLQIPYIVLMGILSFTASRLGWREKT